jgi:hypothetical protein
MTLQAIIELVRFEFRRYGFRADGATIETHSSTVSVDFEREPATGMSAFSQDSVTPYLRIWHEIEGEIALETEIPIPGRSVIELGVGYSHHGSGSNGITRRYSLTVDAFGPHATLRPA